MSFLLFLSHVMKCFIIFLILIGFTGMSFASEYTGETPLYVFDYLKDEPIAYIVNYDIDGYLRNAVVDFDSNTIIFEIKDSGILTIEIPKTHFLPSDYFPTLLIDKVGKDPKEFLTKDEECFKEYEFSVNQNTMIELIMDKSSNDSSIINENVLENCQNKIDDKITTTFDFNTIFEDNLEYTIIDGKQYLSKTIKSSLANLTHDKTIFELSEMKFHLYDDRGPEPVYPGMGIMGLRTPVLFEFPDGVTEEISIKTIPTLQSMTDKQYIDMETYSRSNWPEVGVITGLTPSNQITKLLVFEKNISPHVQLQHGIDPENISCNVGLELIKKYDGSPACVKPVTVDILVERGWTDPLTTYFCFSEYLPVCGVDGVTYGNQCFLEKSDIQLKHNGECENFTHPDYELDETEFLQIKNNMENVGYHICDIQLEENKILIVLNWIFEDSEPEKMILSQIPANVSYEIKYLDEYSDYFISKESVFACVGLENEN